MQLLSLKVARQLLWQQASNLPYDETNTSEVANVNAKINLACERFFSSGTWRGTLQRTVITAYDCQVTLPRELQTILGVRSNFSSGLQVHPIWYEFIGGSCLLAGARGLNDLGEGFCAFRDIPGNLPIVVRSAEDGGSGAVLTIVMQNADGTAQVDVPLNVNATQIDSPLSNKILRLTKPQTAGRIELFYVENGLEVKMAILKPSETDANYRRYRVNHGTTCVDAICKRAYLPAAADIEPVIPNNIGALGEMLLAIQYRDKNDRERYKDAEAKAIAMADADRQQFDGDNQTPMYQVIRGFGAADIPDIGAFGYRGDYVPGHYP